MTQVQHGRISEQDEHAGEHHAGEVDAELGERAEDLGGLPERQTQGEVAGRGDGGDAR